jgi:hypothetical protein
MVENVSPKYHIPELPEFELVECTDMRVGLKTDHANALLRD